MNFKFVHNSINVRDLDVSIAFYKEALNLEIKKEVTAEDGSFKLVFLGNDNSPHLLELTYLKEWDRPYDLGDNEMHLALEVDDFTGAFARHKEMDCVCFENTAMGIYFINDPDGYWVEIIPTR